MVLGSWSIFRTDITEEEKDVFKVAFENFVGVSYEPIAVATQVVQGINYKFFCNAQIVYPNAPNQAAVVVIYAPLEGPAYITDITMLNS